MRRDAALVVRSVARSSRRSSAVRGLRVGAFAAFAARARCRRSLGGRTSTGSEGSLRLGRRGLVCGLCGRRGFGLFRVFCISH